MPTENVSEAQLIEHLENASRIVRQWPEWKQGLLANSTRSTSPTPRPIVQPKGQAEVEQGKDEE